MTNCSAMTHNLFSFTHFRKNASASPLESHSFKTKDLKPFRFTHFQKKGGGGERFLRVPIPSGGRGEGSVRVRTRVTAHGLQRPWILCVINLLCFLYLAHSPTTSPP